MKSRFYFSLLAYAALSEYNQPYTESEIYSKGSAVKDHSKASTLTGKQKQYRAKKNKAAKNSRRKNRK